MAYIKNNVGGWSVEIKTAPQRELEKVSGNTSRLFFFFITLCGGNFYSEPKLFPTLWDWTTAFQPRIKLLLKAKVTIAHTVTRCSGTLSGASHCKPLPALPHSEWELTAEATS